MLPARSTTKYGRTNSTSFHCLTEVKQSSDTPKSIVGSLASKEQWNMAFLTAARSFGLGRNRRNPYFL